MKRFISLTCMVLASSYVGSACADDSWYLGALYSVQKISSGVKAQNLPSKIDLEAVGLLAGYKFNQYFSLEARLAKGTSGYSDTFVHLEQIAPETYHNEDLDSQFSLLVKASYPIYQSFSFYGIAGYTESRIKITGVGVKRDYFNKLENFSYSHSTKDSGFSYGVGLNYQLTEEVNVFVDYQVLPDYDLGVDLSKDWGNTTLGVSYSF
jgi:opacity protein-like surface antigen